MSKDTECTETSISHSKRKGPQRERVSLYQCMQRLLDQKGEHFRKQHFSIFQTAQNVAQYFIQYTYHNDSQYQSYIRTQHGKVHLSDFRMFDERTFKCNVSLKSPSPTASFTFHYKRPQEIPPHRMLVTLHEDLDRVDRVYQKCLWEHCLDDDGVIRPDYVLKWFNKGLVASCDRMKHKSCKQRFHEEFKCKVFETKTEIQKDGTIYIQIMMGNDENDMDKTSFKINFVPSLPLRKLPKQIRIRTPFPDRQQYFVNRDQFKKDVLNDIKKGVPLLRLEARVWIPNDIVGLDKSTFVTWSVDCSSLDDKGSQYLGHVTDPTILENIILLMGKIRNEHLMGLNPVTDQLVYNAVLHVHRQNVGKFVRGDQWFLGVMKVVAAQLQEHNAPSFFINSMNLLEEWDETYVHWMGNEMQKVIKRLKRKPRLLDYYVGTKKRVGFSLESSSDVRYENEENAVFKEKEKHVTGLVNAVFKEKEKHVTDRKEPTDHKDQYHILSVIAESEEIDENDAVDENIKKEADNDDDDDDDDDEVSEDEIDISDDNVEEMSEISSRKEKELEASHNVVTEIKQNDDPNIQKTIFVKQITDDNVEQQNLSHIYC